MLRCTTDKQDRLLQEAQEFDGSTERKCPDCGHLVYASAPNTRRMVYALIDLAEDLAKQLDDANDRLEAIAKKCGEVAP